MATPFTSIYKRFLGKVTDDMYLELTPEETIHDLRDMLIQALPEFEFPRFNLYDYTVQTKEIVLSEATPDMFIIDYDIEANTGVIE